MTVSPPDGGVSGPRLKDRIGAALAAGEAPALIDAERAVPLRTLSTHSFVAASGAELAGRNVLVRTRAPLAAAVALASLDGLAARLVLCPPDLDAAQIAQVAATAEADLAVSDAEHAGAAPGLAHRRLLFEPTSPHAAASPRETEWALFTSGTSGAPKMVAHTLQGLTGAIGVPAPPTTGSSAGIVWATF